MNFSVTILGSSSALPTSNRHLSAQLVNVHEKLFLVDCAEGTQVQLRKMKVRLQRINHIFISHLHGDHYLGLMGLVFTFHLLGRNSPLHVYADPKLEEIINLQLKASNTSLIYPLHFHPVDPHDPKVIYEDNILTVSTFPMDHQIPTCGFLFAEKPRDRKINKKAIKNEKIIHEDFQVIKQGADYIAPDGKRLKNEDITFDPPKPRSYAYCSDTRYSEEYLPHLKDVDLLYHEATFSAPDADKASEKYHSTTVEAAKIALRSNVKNLIIGHFSNRYDDFQLLLEEARSVFPQTELATEGETFNI